MEQRPLRLGDILDDYCPRERRVTNHAVVAMVEDTVKQTRCTTCDAEHAYKGGQAPRRRKKESPSALYKEVLAGKPDDVPVRIAAETSAQLQPAEEAEPLEVDRADESPSDVEVPAMHAAAARDVDVDADDDVEVERGPDVEEGPVHRQLIRAQLPRIEGQKEERRPTDFTIRQSNGRGNAHGNFRGGGGGNDRMRSGRGFGGNSGNAGHGGNQRGNGHRPHGGSRFAGARPGQGQGQGRGQGGGFRSGQQQRQGGGGRKRSR